MSRFLLSFIRASCIDFLCSNRDANFSSSFDELHERVWRLKTNSFARAEWSKNPAATKVHIFSKNYMNSAVYVKIP